MDVDLARPTSWMQPTTVRKADGSERPLPRFERHLLCVNDGLFPEAFNSWEEGSATGRIEKDRLPSHGIEIRLVQAKVRWALPMRTAANRRLCAQISSSSHNFLTR